MSLRYLLDENVYPLYKIPVPGIFILGKKLSFGQNLEELIFLAEASFDDEYRDQIIHLPHSYSLKLE